VDNLWAAHRRNRQETAVVIATLRSELREVSHRVSLIEKGRAAEAVRASRARKLAESPDNPTPAPPAERAPARRFLRAGAPVPVHLLRQEPNGDGAV
jgi:hypothetical protein